MNFRVRECRAMQELSKSQVFLLMPTFQAHMSTPWYSFSVSCPDISPSQVINILSFFWIFISLCQCLFLVDILIVSVYSLSPCWMVSSLEARSLSLLPSCYSQCPRRMRYSRCHTESVLSDHEVIMRYCLAFKGIFYFSV